MTLLQLQRRWQKKTGERMPDSIAALPLEKVLKAVELVESGATVVVPRARRVVEEEEVSSMQQWDKHGEFT
jgi:hypothetical protein